jgi:GrpB-like predicted nucleotidyltransferase (UPF0157 family)
VPFPDERRPVVVLDYRPEWEVDYAMLAARVWALGLAGEGEVEHVGSTSVPGLAAKDVIDVQVRMRALDEEAVTTRFAAIGFRRRPEAWNNVEATRAGPVPKLVFAPPVGHRPANVHVRVHGTQGARDTVLFRDFLRAEPAVRDAWGRFKKEAAAASPETDLGAYARLKDPAWLVLMDGADRWAAQARWSLSPLRPWSATDGAG